MSESENTPAKPIFESTAAASSIRMIGTDSGGLYIESRNVYGDIVVHVLTMGEAIYLMEFLSESTK